MTDLSNKQKLRKLWEMTLDNLLTQVEQSQKTGEPLPVMVTTSIEKFLSRSGMTCEAIEAEDRGLAYLDSADFPFQDYKEKAKGQPQEELEYPFDVA